MITPRDGFCFETKQDETAVLSDNNLPEPLEHEINGVEWEIMWTVGI